MATYGLDFDDTWTTDPGLWSAFVRTATSRGHRVVVVTNRPALGRWEAEVRQALRSVPILAIVFAGTSPKRQAAAMQGYPVDVWIDDAPHTVDQGLTVAGLLANPSEFLEREEYEGRRGEERHLTAKETGRVDPRRLLGLPGARGEHELFAQQHTGAKTPAAWAELVDAIRERGVDHTVLVVVEPRTRSRGRLTIHRGPQIAEGNHRVRAAVEAGADTIPVEIRYFGKAEQLWTVAPEVPRQ